MPKEEEFDIFSTEEQNKKLSQSAKIKRLKEISDVRRILKTPEGRRHFWRMLGLCGIFRSSFNLNSNQTGFNEGQRNVGLIMLKDMSEADVTAFAKAQNEHVSALNSKKEASDG